MTVDDTDLARVWDFVARVHAARRTTDVQSVTHCGLLDLVPCDSVSFNWVAPGRLHATIHPSPGREVLDRFEPVLARRWRENPLAEHFRRTADTRPLTWGDVTDVDTWRASSLFTDLYAPLGVWDQLGTRIPSAPGVVGGLVLNSATSFTERDRAVLGLVGGHIAYRLHVLGASQPPGAGSRRPGWDVVSVDHDHRVVSVGGDTATEAGCREGERVPDALAPLLAPDPSRPVDGLVPPTEPQVVTTAAGPVTALVVPGWPGPHTIFLRRDDRDAARTPDRGLLAGSGLSPRQSDVALLLAEGESNQRIATLLGISLGTVKKHCQHVFATLEVDNRAAAGVMLVRMLG